MKLELKHLAAYLPYRLKIIKENKHYLLTATQNSLKEIGIDYVIWQQFKPVLKPLSEIENSIFDESGYFDKSSLISHVLREDCKLDLFIELVSNHYDVFGLIEQGLAVDVNTLKP